MCIRDRHLPLYIVRKHPEISKEERFQHQASYCFSELAAYRNQLVQWQEQYAPQSPDDDLHPRFLEALHHLDDVEYQLDVLQYGTDQERQEAVQEYMQNQTKQMCIRDRHWILTKQLQQSSRRSLVGARNDERKRHFLCESR